MVARHAHATKGPLPRDFHGSNKVLKVAVRSLRAQAAAAALTQHRFETLPGEQSHAVAGLFLLDERATLRPMAAGCTH